MNEEIRKARNEYARNWRKNNPEKVQKINERFWTKKLKEMEESKNETNATKD